MAALRKMASAVCSLVFVATLMSHYPVSCLDNTVSQCPYQCSCTIGSRDYEVNCPLTAPTNEGLCVSARIKFEKPLTDNSSISAHFVNDDYAYIQCYNILPEDYAKIPTISIPNHQDVEMKFSFAKCPIPPGPLADVIMTFGCPEGLSKLKTLFFQSPESKLSKTLKRIHFQGLESINRLVLSGNGFTDLPEDLFMDLKNLTWLDLRFNSVILKPHIFEPLANLSILELGQNKITELPKGLFKHLSKLTQLNLWQNRLQNLSGDVFDGLDSLESLDLSTNELVSFPADIFHKLPKLRILNLLSNNFSSLPGNLFSHNPNLEYLRLVENKQTLHELPYGFLSNLTNMHTLILTRSRIEQLSDSVFWGTTNLINISFEGNNIKEIKFNLFRDQMNLENLNFDRNKISKIEDGAFRTLRKLKTLNLNNNRLTHISNALFKNLESLEKLLIQRNNLQEISYMAFENTIRLNHLDLSYNSLTLMRDTEVTKLPQTVQLDLTSPFHNIFKLKYLNLSHNLISHIFLDWYKTFTQLNYLDLSYNNIMKITFDKIYFLSNMLTVDLSSNNITEILFKDIEEYGGRFFDGPRPPRNVTVLMGNNPVICDCTMYYFARYLANELGSEVKSVVDVKPDNIKCAAPKNLEGRLFSEVKVHELVCPYDDGINNSRCLPGCICYFRASDSALVMNCSDVRSDNHIVPDIKSDIDPFKQFEVHYENNKLTTLSDLPKNRQAYDRVTRLYVAGNNISSLSVEDIPKKIEIFDIKSNHLEVMNKSVVKFLENSTTLKELWVSNNPFKCVCENHEFFSFLQVNPLVQDYNITTCSDGQKVSSIKLIELCGSSRVMIAVSIIVALTGLFIGILFGLYYKYRLEVKVWLYSKDIWWGSEPDDDKLYDAFISYSHKDEEFITKSIVPHLEDSGNYKLCLHYRNWVPGEFIPTQIASSVEQSRRTLVILSPNFLESVWGRMEFRTAHQRALKEGRARVIVVLYGDIGPTDNLDPELKAYLSMNTYVKWGDPWFWDKLKYALPHKKKSINHSPAVTALKKKGFDDKLELIHPTSPSTPPGQNTPPAHQAHTNPLMNHVNSYPNGLNGLKPPYLSNGTITMNGLRVNGNARHSDV